MGASKIRSGRCGQGSLHSQMQMQPTRNQKYISTERAGNYSPIRAAEFSVCAASGQPDSVLFWFFFWVEMRREPRLFQSSNLALRGWAAINDLHVAKCEEDFASVNLKR